MKKIILLLGITLALVSQPAITQAETFCCATRSSETLQTDTFGQKFCRFGPNNTDQRRAQRCTSSQTCNEQSGLCQSQTNSIDSVIGQINPPEAVSRIGFGAEGLSNFLSKIVELIFVAATIIFVFMVLITGVQWILSGGDKEAVANARKRLTWAIIGVIFLALSFVILRGLGQITGFEFFAGQNVEQFSPAGKGNSDAAP